MDKYKDPISHCRDPTRGILHIKFNTEKKKILKQNIYI